MNLPENLKYASSHEWARVEGNRAYIGISDHAQHSLGDIVFFELPQVGKTVKAGDPIAVVESVKAVSDVYSPLSGKIIEANQSLADAPEQINSLPYESWMAVIEISDASEIEKLLSKTQYQEICKD